MRRLLSGIASAVVLAVGLGSLPIAAQGTNQMTVTVDGLPAGSILTVAINGGKIGNSMMTAMPANGTVMLALDLGNLGKTNAVRVEVYIEDCDNNEVKALVVEEGTMPQADNCRNRKRGGAFWWGKDTKITIHYGGGVSTGINTRTYLIAGGAGLGAVIIGVAAKGGSDSSSSNNSSTPGGNNPGGNTGGTTISLTGFAGSWVGTGRAGTNTCNFSSNAQISGTIAITDANTATITWTKLHVTPNVTFTYPNVHLNATSSTQASFTASKSQVIGSGTFVVNDAASINGTTMTVTQTFSGPNNCTVVYQITLSKQ